MTSEEEFNNAVWWTLQEIELTRLFSEMKNLVDEKKSDVIDFEIKDKSNAPPMDSQRRAVEFLEKREALNIISRKYPVNMPQMSVELYNVKPIGYDLHILPQKFEELYKSYGNSAEIRKRAILETFFKETEQKEKEIPTTHSHTNTIGLEKLKIFRGKIGNAAVFDNSFKQLLGIELFDFIQSNSVLKNEFDRRVNYLITLAQDNNFNILQDKLFETIQKILKFISLEEVKEIQKKWNNKLINKLKTKIEVGGKEKDFLTLPELYFTLQKKDNYYRLIDRSYFSPTEEISIRTHIIPVIKQYEIDVKKFFNLVFNNDFFKKIDKKTSTKLYELFEIYDDYWYKLNELIYHIPIKLHFRNFEHFFLDCLKFYPKRGFEWLFNSDYQADTQQFKKIKENALMVIDDLVATLEKGITQPQQKSPIRKELERRIEKAKEIKELKQEILNDLKKEEIKIENQPQDKENKDIIKVKTEAGLLIFNKSTGFVKLGSFKPKENLNPQSQEAKVLLKLMTGKNYLAIYKDLISENVSKISKRKLGFVIRNLKKILGILPKKKAKNKNCIRNIKQYGYKLIT